MWSTFILFYSIFHNLLGFPQSPYQSPSHQDKFTLVQIIDGPKVALHYNDNGIGVSNAKDFVWTLRNVSVSHVVKYTGGVERKIQNILDLTDPSIPDSIKSSELWPKPDDTDTIYNFAVISSNSYSTRYLLDWRNLTDYKDVLSHILIGFHLKCRLMVLDGMAQDCEAMFL